MRLILLGLFYYVIFYIKKNNINLCSHNNYEGGEICLKKQKEKIRKIL